MATRDILVLNTTASRAETQQSSDTVLIKGGGEILSIENSSNVDVLTINSSGSTTQITGDVVSTGDLTGAITGSFGKVEGVTFIGSAAQLTNTDLPGTLSSSAQIAAVVTGSFRQGFEFTREISGSKGSTGSFDRIIATTFFGPANELNNTAITDTISGSAQIATSISGSFTNGFEFDGTIKRTRGTWSATNPVNKARQQATAFGSQNSTVLAGGNVDPKNESETWNGTNWSEGDNLNTGRHALASAGNATAGLVFGGNPAIADAETYDGSSYTEVGNLNTGRYALGGFGTQNSAIAAGGAVSEYNNICAFTEVWNGTNWTETADMNNPKWYFGSAGDSSESGIIFGGSTASPAFAVGIATTEQWNGTSWSEVNDLNVNLLYTRGQGSTNNAIVAGGLINSPTNTFSTCTETWDGTSWSIEGSLNVAGRYLGIGGNGDGAIAGGWSVPASPYTVANSELFEASLTTGSFGRIETTTITGDASRLTNYIIEGTISSSAQIATSISGSFNKGFNYTGRLGSTLDVWSSGNNFNIGTLSGTSAGSSKHSALKFGGRFAPNNAFSTCTEEWNGTNWSEVNNMNDNRHEGMGGGSSESALSTGGCNGSGIASPALTEYYNGTNWAECADLITARKNGASAGTTADIIVAGGAAPSATTHVELYDLAGNAWSETTETPTALSNLDAVGTQNSTFIANDAPNSSLEWNGNAWSTAAGSIIDRSYFGLVGTVNDAVQVGATNNTPTLRTCTEKWNGYSWSVGVDAIYSQGAQKVFQGTGRSAVQFGSSQNDGTSCTQTQMYEASDDFADIDTLTAQTLFGDGSELENTKVDNMVSSSAQIATSISGSFNKGFEFDGKIEKVPDGWSAGPNMIFARTQQASAANSRDAVIVFGGRYGSTPAGSFNNGAPNCVEEYNGTNWSEITDLPSGRYQIWGAGHAESALSGDSSGNSGTDGVEYYNGTNWAEAASLITAVNKSAGTGDGGGADAAVVVGGVPGYKCFQQYDLSGDAWTELGDPIFNVASVGATGPSDAVIIPGYVHPGAPTAGSQCWPGSTWASFSSHTINRAGQTGIFGTQNDAIVMGGSGNVGNNRCCTEAWDGTAWSECNPAPTGIAGQTALQGNSGNAGLAAGTSYGVTSPTPSCGHHTWNGTQLWNGGYVNSGSFGRIEGIKFIGSGKNVVNFPVPTGTVSGSGGLASDISASFTSGFEFSSGDISGSINSTGSFNNLKATKFFGDGKHLTNTALKDTVSGSSQIASNISGSFSGKFDYRWSIRAAKGAFTVGGALITDRCNAGGFGNKNAAIVAGGRSPAASNAPNNWPGGQYNAPMGAIKQVESYNGVSWSETTELIYARDKMAGAGTSTDGILAGGGTAPNSVAACTETWDGSSWTEKSDMNYCTKNSGAAGESSNAAIVFGGEYATPASHYVAESESWDGSSWSEIDNLNYGRTGIAGFGTAVAAIAGAGTPTPGGHAPGNAFDVEEWDGTSWTRIANTLTGNFVNYHHGHGAGAGTVNDGHIFGGYYFYPSAPTTRTDSLSQHWDGTSWAYGDRLVVGRADIAGDGTSGGDAFAAGGIVDSACSTLTEEYTQTYTTASVGHICAVKLKGELNELSNVTFPDGRISSSAQFNEEISGSFNKGFEYTGDIRSAKGAWSIGGYMVRSRRCLSGAGIQNAALATGGQTANYGNAYCKCSEEYDGTSWTEGNDMIIPGRERAQVGTQNASLLFGGWNTCDDTEEYNGTNYATAANMAIGRYAMIGFGTQNAAIGAGGTVSDSNGGQSATEQYDGASWTNQVSMITPRFIGGAGTINSAIVGFGRNTPTRAMNCTELWNGTAWSETVEAIVTGEQGVSYGTQNTFAITAGCGESPYPALATTQFFDGISYSTDGNLITAGYNRCGANKAGQDAGLVFGGYENRTMCQTEEYNAYYTTGSFGRVETPDVQLGGDSQLKVSASLQIPVYATSVGIVSSSAGQMFFTTGSNQLNFTIDVNGWSAGGSMILARGYNGGAGTQNAAITAGGAPGAIDATEQYDGTAWTFSEGHDLDLARSQGVMTGTQNSALLFGGQVSPSVKGETECFNGSAWTEVGDLNKTRRLHQGFGTQNAALAAGGYTTTPTGGDTPASEEWNGDVWTAAADLNAAKGFGAGGGTQNAGIIFGGAPDRGTGNAHGNTETYDGTTWTEVNDMNVARVGTAGGGTQNAAVTHGGELPSGNTTCTEEWNGTSWSTANVLPVVKRTHGHAGNQSAALAFGGQDGSGYVDTNYEYSVCGLKTISIDGV